MEKHIVTLVMNGAMGLILALVLIKAFGKILLRFFDNLVSQMRESGQNEIEEIRGLRTDVKASGALTAAAVVGLTDRVSRIEGKVEGIAFARTPEMSDRDPTPIHGVRYSGDDDNTPVHIPPETALRRARTAAGSQRADTPGLGTPSSTGLYSQKKLPPRRP